jgi:hypothetical protein
MEDLNVLRDLPAWAGALLVVSVVLTGLAFYGILVWRPLHGRGDGRELVPWADMRHRR